MSCIKQYFNVKVVKQCRDNDYYREYNIHCHVNQLNKIDEIASSSPGAVSHFYLMLIAIKTEISDKGIVCGNAKLF